MNTQLKCRYLKKSTKVLVLEKSAKTYSDKSKEQRWEVTIFFFFSQACHGLLVE